MKQKFYSNPLCRLWFPYGWTNKLMLGQFWLLPKLLNNAKQLTKLNIAASTKGDVENVQIHQIRFEYNFQKDNENTTV